MDEKKIEFKRRNKRLQMAHSQVTVQRLSNYFQVEYETLFIKEEWGEMSHWPREDGTFDLANVDDFTPFEVMGNAKENNIASAYTPPSTSGMNTASSAFSRPFCKKPTSTSGFGCKIVLAEMEKTAKGVAFEERNQTFITVQEETANVRYITEKIKEKFGDEMILVSGNGLPIVDEEGTRGSKFWKVPSRKVYAVKNSGGKKMLQKKGKKRKSKFFQDSSSDSEDNEDTTKSKKMELSELTNMVSSLQSQIATLSSSVESMMKIVVELTTVSSKLPLPVGLVKMVNDAFKCKICLALPMKPPVIGTRCCSTLLACSSCVDNWYSGEEGLTKTCPNCREPRGYAQTYQMKGLDEFLEGFRGMLSHEESQQADQ